MAKSDFIKNMNSKQKIFTASLIGIIALVLIAVIVIITVTNAGGMVYSDGDLMEGYSKNRSTSADIDNTFKSNYRDFCFKVAEGFQNSTSNVAVSLTNIYSACALMANNSSSDTQKELKDLVGDPDSAARKIAVLEDGSVYDEDDNLGVKYANDLWINNTVMYGINRSFLKYNSKYTGLGVYRGNFNSNQEIEKARKYTSDATGGNVCANVDFDHNQIMYSISAASFIGGWKQPADRTTLYNGTFFGAHTEEPCEFFRTVEDKYYSHKYCEGILKEYSDKYSFAAFVPKKMSDGEYYSFADTFLELGESGENFSEFFTKYNKEKVAVTLPEFSNSVNTPTTSDVSAVLKTEGVKRLFGANAEVTGITEDTKTLRLDKMIASGDISITTYGSDVNPTEGKKLNVDKWRMIENKVTFDRGFIYFILDNETMLPIYFGYVNTVVQ